MRRLAAVIALSLLALEGFLVPVTVVASGTGESTWHQNADYSVTIYFNGNSTHSISLHWSVVDQSGTWLNTTDTPMAYSQSSGNFSATIGPFEQGTTIQWVFHDLSMSVWYNLKGQAYSNWSYTVQGPAPTIGSVRMSVSTDKYTYSTSDHLVITIQVTNVLAAPLNDFSVNSTIFNSKSQVVLRLPTVYNATIASLSTMEFNVSASISLADSNYVIVSTAFLDQVELGSANVPLVVLNTAGKPPLTLAFVFHMHQPIYLNLQGQFEQPYVQQHSGSDFQYNGAWYGAYYWHVYMLETHPTIKVTFNLQPSLLYQWNVTMHNFEYNGSYPGGQAELSRDLAAVNATVAGYRELAASGQAEILTSPFYHPLSAILVNMGWSSDLVAQIEKGRNYTDDFMGVQAQGMWTPEMGFTMGMVPILQETGIKYTVLDEANHFVGAKGPSDNSSIYQPFELDGANGSHIIVFFRDTQISDDLVSVWNRQANPRVAASDFIAAAADVYRSHPGGVLTIASDGENPISSGYGVVSALDFNAIYGAIASSQGWLQTSTLGSIVASRNVTAKLTYVPDGSWSGGFGLWIGSPSKNAIWHAISQSRSALVNLTKQYGADNPEIQKLWNYLYIAEGSDWEWQTPGPTWFAMQGYRYATAAMTYVPPAASTTTAATLGPSSAGLAAYALPLAITTGAVVLIASLLVVRRGRKKH